jgi:hypothetical protein
MLFRSLPTCKRLPAHVAAKHGTMRRCAAMLHHRFLAAELLVAFAAYVNTLESCVISARVIPQHDLGSEMLGADGTSFCHGEEYLL